MVVVVVRDDDDVDRAQRRERKRGRMQAPGTGERERRAALPQTGSNSTRCPSISASTLEWPIQVTLSPVAGGLARSARVVACTGTVPAGERRGRCSLSKKTLAKSRAEPEGRVRAGPPGFTKTPSL